MNYQSAEASNGPGNRALIAIAAVFLVIFAARFVALFQGDQIGSDYAYFYPKLAAYQYWIERNGYLSIPHFLPYICGGIFDFADPTSFYLSFPTVASLALPFGWVWPATVVVFGAIGFGGGYVLARHGLRLGRMAALVCGAVILFNGFYFTRMAVGHVTFHGFMLFPWIAAICVVKDGTSWLPGRAAIGITGLAYAYLLHSGGIYQIIPSAISTLVIVLMASINGRDLVMGTTRYFVGAAAGALISAPRIVETLHLMSHFPRDHHPLPGFSGLLEAVQFLFSTLFFWPSLSFAEAHVVNLKYSFELHEAVYGVSVLPLAAFAIFALTWIGCRKVGVTLTAIGRYFALITLLALPVVINVYDPQWNQFLKKIPVIGQSLNLIRYFSVYIVPLAAFTAFVLDRSVREKALRTPLFIAAIAIPLFSFLDADLGEFTRNGYDSRKIVSAFQGIDGEKRRPIVAVAAFWIDGEIVPPMGRDDLMVDGLSQLACYQPLFGYRLEKFPKHNLHLGRADDLTDEGTYNFRNPSCYVFPSYNKCLPGDNFRKGQEKDLAVFLDYGLLNYTEPAYMTRTRVLSVFVLVVVLAGIIIPVAGWRRRRANGAAGGSWQQSR